MPRHGPRLANEDFQHAVTCSREPAVPRGAWDPAAALCRHATDGCVGQTRNADPLVTKGARAIVVAETARVERAAQRACRTTAVNVALVLVLHAVAAKRYQRLLLVADRRYRGAGSGRLGHDDRGSAGGEAGGVEIYLIEYTESLYGEDRVGRDHAQDCVVGQRATGVVWNGGVLWKQRLGLSLAPERVAVAARLTDRRRTRNELVA